MRSSRFVATTAAVVLLGVVAGAAGSSAGERIPGAGIRYQAFGPGGPTRTLTIANPDQGDVIVKLNGRPLAEEWRAARRELVASEGGVAHRRLRRRMPASVAQAAERLRMQHQRVADALASFDAQEQATRGRISPNRIRFRFTRTFNGLVVRASARAVERLRQHPDVEFVRPAVRVEKALAESTVTIGAPELWSRGLSGAGVVVGVIDSGVDYTHPDLGGGYGPSFKVIGGYDFVNDDDDPRDDNGHGTHVAGIIAANGEVKGVAPDARIMAYKVLDAGGGGWDSDVIQALERACDPDGDPMTDDAVDVVNLSLGGPGTPDDPLSQAVDNAFAAGVLVVVAAGNEGHAGERTIGSPGCARNALTVGASDDAEKIASFSSTGPTDFTHAIKPDLVAPGVAIRSTFPGGAYATLDGTSMASPHVAAAAALLLQQEPSLTAAVLKSRLMLSSRDIGASLYAQGSGRLDLPAALDLRTTVVPASISFGLDEPAQLQFSGIAVLEVTNQTATARDYSVSPHHEMPDGVMLSVAPSSFSLGPGATARVFVGIQVDNSVVPDVPEPPFGYTGNLRVASEGEELRVPFSFVKSPCLRLAFDAAVDNVRAYDEDGRRWSLWLPPGGATMLLPKGQYRLVVQGTEYPAGGAVRPWQVLRDGVAVPGEVSIRRAEARHVVRSAARAIDGAGMRGGWRYTLRTPVAGVRFETLLLNYKEVEYAISDAAAGYLLDWLFASRYTPDEHLLWWHSKGLHDGRDLTNDPSELREARVRFDVDQTAQNLYLFSDVVNQDGQVMHRTVEDLRPSRRFYLMGTDDPEALVQGIQFSVRTSAEDDAAARLLTPVVRPKGEHLELLLNGSSDLDGGRLGTPLFEVSPGELVFGLEPYAWFGRFRNGPDHLSLGSALGGKDWLFVGGLTDAPVSPALTYRLTQSLFTRPGFLPGASERDQPFEIPVAPGPVQFSIVGPSGTVAGLQATSSVSTAFDTTAADPNPPYMSHFSVLCDGKPSRSVPSGRSVAVRFRAYDDSALADVRVYARLATLSTWWPLDLRRDGDLFTALPSGFQLSLLTLLRWVSGGREIPVSLRIVLRDGQGNTVTNDLSPAFGYGGTPAP